ncbi:MAG: hypothetical protein LUD22_04285 [Coprobacillus sp.]|nr:hypothetical protein [Coprobacillus sp.]
MKKSYYLLLVLPLLLIGCSEPKEDNSSVVTPEEDNEDYTGDILALESFYNTICSLEGQVNKYEQEMVTTYDYGAISISQKTIAEVTRYQDSNEEPILVEEGKYAFDDNGVFNTFYNYTTQTYHDDTYAYQITDYEDEYDVDSIETIYYYPENKELIFDIGFANSCYYDFQTMISVLDNPLYTVSFDNLECEIIDNALTYAYAITIYQEDETDRVIEEYIEIDNVLYLEDNLISKVQQSYYDVLYAGGLALNFVTYDITLNYFQGDYPLFEGDLFDPSNYA